MDYYDRGAQVRQVSEPLETLPGVLHTISPATYITTLGRCLCLLLVPCFLPSFVNVVTKPLAIITKDPKADAPTSEESMFPQDVLRGELLVLDQIGAKHLLCEPR